MGEELMAALPYMPLFVADYLADTAHLTPAQHGAYLLLIMNYWQRGAPLPNDDARLASIAKMNKRDWAHNRASIIEFFEVQDVLLVHPRITHELSRVADKSLKSKKAAQASVERRFGERSTPVEPTDTDNNREEDSEANASADVQVIDPEAVMWRHGRLYLQSQGIAASRIGSLLGEWKRDYGAGLVIEALGRAQREGAIDCVAFIRRCLGGTKGRRGDYDPNVITV